MFLKISLIIIISMLFIRPLFKRTLQPLTKPTTSISETVINNYIENEDAFVHGYYSSIEEAMKHNRFGKNSEPANYTIKKKIKILEDDESCILYAVNIQPDGAEIFSLFKFKITCEQDKKIF